MGKIYQGILGPVSGKVGGTVGSSWKGISLVKGYQPVVSNPQTAAQVANRDKMGFVVMFAQAILATVIKPLWDRFASKMSGYNAFVSANKALFTTEIPSDYSALVISSGKMAATTGTSPVVDVSDTTASIEWVDDSGQGFKLATDKAYITVANATKKTVEGGISPNTRNDASATLALQNAYTAGDVCHVYLSFLRADGSVVSNSSHIQVAAQA